MNKSSFAIWWSSSFVWIIDSKEVFFFFKAIKKMVGIFSMNHQFLVKVLKIDWGLLKVAFFQKMRCVLQNIYSKSLSWTWNLNKLFTVIGRKFKFQVQDSDLEYFFWWFDKHITLSENKPPLPQNESDSSKLFSRPFICIMLSIFW